MEKSINGRKQMTYRLIKDDKHQLDTSKKDNKKYVLTFDM